MDEKPGRKRYIFQEIAKCVSFRRRYVPNKEQIVTVEASETKPVTIIYTFCFTILSSASPGEPFKGCPVVALWCAGGFLLDGQYCLECVYFMYFPIKLYFLHCLDKNDYYIC